MTGRAPAADAGRPRLVLDTNVVMEWLHYQDPRCAALAAGIAAGWVCLADESTLAELARVLGYAQFALPEAARAAHLAGYAARVVRVPPGPPPVTLPRCRDPDDQKFLELAARGGATWLVTRDRELLRCARRRHQPLPFSIVLPEAVCASQSEKASAGSGREIR